MARFSALLLLCLLVAGWDGARAQISPGPLSDAHAELDGVTHCRNCHGGGDEGLDGRCLACHGEIAWLRDQDRGLHGREGRDECSKCHPEHAGRDFELVDWGKGGRDGFDHARAGWELQGAHAKLECDKCHRSELRQQSVLLRRPDGSGDDTWLGLEPASCTSCHTSPHSARIGQQCESCHTSKSWKETQNFDHDRTAYRLTGRHVKLECAACHQNGKFGRTADRDLHYFPIDFAECGACHKDPHTGRFGPGCSGCHVTSDFKTVPAERFDHARTRFPLRGAHAKVKCDRCHDETQGGWGKRPAFDRCQTCHEDAHAGTATLAGQVVDCDACHEERAFDASKFDLAMHRQTAYPLEGRHAQVDCHKCHKVDKSPASVARHGSAGVDLRPAFASCAECHADDHAGQLAGRYVEKSCATCHTVDGFKPATIGVTWHASTRFPLAGAHARAECGRCHAMERPGLRPLDPGFTPGKANVALVIPERVCLDCHVDVHQGRYQQSARFRACEKCHTQDAFVPSTVDFEMHEDFAFRLRGAHQATPCFLCHKQLESKSHLLEGTHALVGEAAPPDVVLWEAPSACQACHRTEEPR